MDTNENHASQGFEPALAPAVAPTRRRRWWLFALAGGVALVLAVAAAAVVLVVVNGGNGASDQFESVSGGFHAKLEPLMTSMNSSLARAGDGLLDPVLREAQDHAEAIADLYASYGKDVAAIVVPPAADGAKTRLVKVTGAGQVIMANVARFFTASQTKTALERFLPQLERNLATAETDLRDALST